MTLVGVTAGPATSATGTTVPLKASLVLSPTRSIIDQRVVADIHKSTVPQGTTFKKATIAWGDGNKTTVTSRQAKPSHHYSHAGKFTVTATVTDSRGKSAHASRTETVFTQHVYWTLFNGQSLSYMLESARLPLKTTSHDLEITGTSHNQLRCTAGMTVHGGRVWVLTYPSGCSTPYPAQIAVFAPPVTQSSAPVLTFNLPGSGAVDHIRFDNAGHLWASDAYNNAVYEFKGSFASSRSLTAAVTLTNGISKPGGVAIDSAGDVFVSNTTSTGTHSIAVFHAPVSASTTPTFLNGLTGPGGLIFDTKGNLYASSNPGGQGAIVRYNKGHMGAGSHPSVVDATGPNHAQYEADFAWDAAHNLYDADCGSNPSIRLYHLSTARFTSSLRPSVVYTNSSLKSICCAWGIAIR
jgi:PKD repeat protein